MNFLRTFCCGLVLMMAAQVLADDKPTQPANTTTSAQTAPAAQASSASDQNQVNEKWMVEGQKRYSTNCGRCHQSPRQFSPREMSMAVRHMRVRAMLTQEDMDYLLYYMTHQ